ncbi:MAG: hypothetical protein DYH18_07555 [Xanthomonadales bacterium PRO7]|nr:hypothetical protein [Xanthomonadales bacterium PRO7]
MYPANDRDRTVPNLDMSPARSGIFTPGIARLELNADNLARFNATLARVNPNVPPCTAEQIAGSARRVLRASAKGVDMPFIRLRLRRAAEIRAAYVDTCWHVPADLYAIMGAIVDYIDDGEHHLISRDMAVIGQLDDALLVDAAMDTLRGELNEYAEFCRFRQAEAARIGLPASALALDREHWRRECDQELLFEQQLRRVRATRYTRAESAADGFRVG